MRVQQQAACILHARDYSETSLTLEVFSARFGRLGLLAKGARRPSSRVRGMLEPFQPLLLSWTGRGELPILTAAEPDGESSVLAGAALYCGFYLNELLLRLLHRHDPHETLYDAYREALTSLASSDNTESVLRRFERQLLSEIGYGLVLDHDADSNAAIDAQAWYDYIPERGPVQVKDPDPTRSQGVLLRGTSLIALAKNELVEIETLRDAKRLMRAMLARYLGDQPLHSRKLFHVVGVRDSETSTPEKVSG